MLVPILGAGACSLDDGDEGYSLSRDEASELRAMCEQHGGGMEFRPITPSDDADESCRLMVAFVSGGGPNCPDFATLKKSWELYLTEGGETYGDCSNLR